VVFPIECLFDMSDGSSQEASVLPPRPPKRRGLAIWLSLVISVTVAVVLFANDGRNLKIVMHRLGIDHSTRTAYPPKQDLPQTGVRSARSWPFGLPVGSVQDAIMPFRLPDQRCLDLAVAGQDPPQFTTENGGIWQCVMFWTASEEPEAPSIFLQIRGNAYGDIIAWRAKFSKSGSDGTEIASQGLEMLRKALQPLGLSEEIFAALDAKIQDWQPFYYVMGTQRLSFRPEFSDPSRFNLLAQRGGLRAYVPPPISALRFGSGGGVEKPGVLSAKSGRLGQGQ
jgi:hypothetical protein